MKIKITDYCWLWTGSICGTMGYGQFLSPIHKCNIPLCVNPEHLFIGTPLENLLDMRKKGRGNIGEKNGQAKLRDSQISRIIKVFDLGLLNCEELSRAFLVDGETIRLIVNRRNWKHISPSPQNTGN